MPPPSLLAPPTSARAPASSTLSTSTLPATLRPREKVLLAPGHSPLDWALLSATHRARPQNPMYPETRISAAQLAACNGRLVKVRDGSGRKERRPVWMALGGVVYDVASYVDFHPGGVEQLMRGTGKDGTGLFLEAHGFVSWNSMLAGLEVGRFVKDG